MSKIGLKLWSTNTFYIQIVNKLYNEKVFDYIELSAIPNSFDDTISYWRDVDIPFIIHAPHFMQGLNFSDNSKEKENILLAEYAFKFADNLKAKYVIFHPGIEGDYKETAKQISKISDSRTIIENKPYNVAVYANGLSENDICVGYLPSHIKYIADTAKIGICVDVGHCFCAANAINEDKYTLLQEFVSLNPKMYHISDGDINGATDKHFSIGSGSYDFEKIFSILPKDIQITLETEKSSKNNLDDFKNDCKNLKKYLKS